MRTYIYKDYYIKDDWLKKDGVDDHKHLLHKFSSVPAIYKKVWEEYKGRVLGIAIRTKNRTIFRIKASEFDALKKECDFGYDPQYYVERPYWDITQQTVDEKTKESKEQLLVV